ncbi:uncharacterized protein LOC116305979 isoform X2 [Actinia tenebrosa]|uniref:Uncharacterized protein LOC116305979 isoform X2 n=1 Tax=Actinia tenebrosa TaxID=6105 RepID=A0A6P8IXN2_ACTTE|nr:uncharacterized protein LOC116305979 isoform X2 [Actinia tenebrosa]XP_031571858.1 uncharacterized protein LOC116305979 isoform X2 [Actinia tenebrosa]
MVKNSGKVPKEYNTLKTEVLELNMSYMSKKKEKEDLLTGQNEQSQEHSVTKMDNSRKKLYAKVEDLGFFRARSLTCKDVGTFVKDDRLRLRPKEQGSRTLDKELRGGLASQQHSPMNSPLAARKFGRHLFEKRSSLPNPLHVCSVTNSPRFSRRNSDFISSKQAGLSAEDIRNLSESLSQLEKAKPRPKPYEEKPFYLCPENGSFRRNYWESESVALEKRISDAQRRRVSRVEEEKVQEERPLAKILPPFKLSSIYTQESNKAKRKEPEKETKRKARVKKKNGSNERLSVDVSLLTKDLTDCRYLRIPKNS